MGKRTANPPAEGGLKGQGWEGWGLTPETALLSCRK